MTNNILVYIIHCLCCRPWIYLLGAQSWHSCYCSPYFKKASHLIQWDGLWSPEELEFKTR